jgi:hypothetical protein
LAQQYRGYHHGRRKLEADSILQASRNDFRPTHHVVNLLIDDEYLNNATEGFQPTGKPSVMGLFISSCNLFELLEEILKSFYSGEPFPDLSKQETASEMAKAFIAPVLQYNRRLDKFIDSVPDYLKLTEYGDGMKFSNNSVTLQQQVLYCRYVDTGRYSEGRMIDESHADSYTCAYSRFAVF